MVIEEISLEVRFAACPLLISFFTVIVKSSMVAGGFGRVLTVSESCGLRQGKLVVANVEFVTCSR